MLSCRGLCNGLITRPEETYRLWRVVVCDLETSKEEAKSPLKGCEYKPTMGCDAERKKNSRPLRVKILIVSTEGKMRLIYRPYSLTHTLIIRVMFSCTIGAIQRRSGMLWQVAVTVCVCVCVCVCVYARACANSKKNLVETCKMTGAVTRLALVAVKCVSACQTG